MRTFAIVYMVKQFGLASSTATMVSVGIGLGAIIGVLFAGRLADRLIGRGLIDARIVVTGTAFLLTVGLFLPGLLVSSFALTLVFFFLAAIGLGSTNPPLDAARLDIMHSRLWGRAESIRVALRYLFEAAAPVSFGFVASLFTSGPASNGQMASASAQGGAQSAAGLQHTFLIMLIVMVISGLLMLFARRTYPRDVATALASEHAAADEQSGDDDSNA
jgi:MFS family permease